MIPRHLQIALVLLLLLALGLGMLTLHMKRKAENLQQHSDSRPVAPPVSGPMETVALYVASDADGTLQKRDAQMALPKEPGERARHILRSLLAVYLEKSSTHPVGDGADVKDVYLVDENTAVIDTNAAFADLHRSGVLVEELSVVSMIETLSDALPKVSRVKILVDGRERETLAGHADLKLFYDVAAVKQIAAEMQ